MTEFWTNREIQFLLENTCRMKDKELVLVLNKMRVIDGRRLLTIKAIQRKRAKLGIVKGHGERINPVIKVHGGEP
jgi:hypothetical protein